MKLRQYSKIIGTLSLVVLCSGALGAAVALRVQHQRQDRERPVVPFALEAYQEHLAKQLQLTPEQQEQVAAILDRRAGEMRAILTNAVTELRRTRKEAESELRPLLTADQNRRLDELARERGQLRDQWQRGERLNPEQRQRLRERVQEHLKSRTNASSESIRATNSSSL
jgi:hypothetical protein